MLITTGKNPDDSVRRLSRALFLSIPGSRLEGRGRRTLHSLLSRAARLRFARACVIYSAQGRPATISFLSLSGPSRWKWLSPRLTVKSAKMGRFGGRQQAAALSITGAKKATLRRLLDPVRQDSGGVSSSLAADRGKLSFSIGGKTIAALVVSYEK